ncbi:MAG: stage V sporulation protein S [Atribacterota bacterium]
MTTNNDANFVNSDDPAFLAVKGHFDEKEDAKRYIKQLAQAIFVVFQKHETAKLRCIGAASLNNAVKAVIIASGEAKKKGFNLALVPSFTTVQFDNNEERTALLCEVTRID